MKLWIIDSICDKGNETLIKQSYNSSFEQTFFNENIPSLDWHIFVMKNIFLKTLCQR
jgi:hypothetical protein